VQRRIISSRCAPMNSNSVMGAILSYKETRRFNSPGKGCDHVSTGSGERLKESRLRPNWKDSGKLF
jgi:hypothetical protein